MKGYRRTTAPLRGKLGRFLDLSTMPSFVVTALGSRSRPPGEYTMETMQRVSVVNRNTHFYSCSMPYRCAYSIDPINTYPTSNSTTYAEILRLSGSIWVSNGLDCIWPPSGRCCMVDNKISRTHVSAFTVRRILELRKPYFIFRLSFFVAFSTLEIYQRVKPNSATALQFIGLNGNK